MSGTPAPLGEDGAGISLKQGSHEKQAFHSTAFQGCVHSSAAFKTGAKSEAQQQLVSEQWDFLCQLEMVGEEGAFVLGWDEVLTEEELSVALKVRIARWGKSCKREHRVQLGIQQCRMAQ